jgi:putative acetyltransferase
MKRLGVSAVFVLGHPGYYPRFGFVPASQFGFHCEFECPDEAFMALELAPEALTSRGGGIVHYRREFSGG